TTRKPIESAALHIVEGQSVFNQFAYPLPNVTGKVAFGPDPVTGDKLELINVRGYGIKRGPNEKNTVVINGTIAPINADAEVKVRITGEHVVDEPAVRAALPKEARAALKTLDPSGRGDFPRFLADVTADIMREEGLHKPFRVKVGLDLKDAA